MTETVPPPLGASPTARPATRPDHVPRLHDALREHSGFTARALPGAPAITHRGCALATGAARVQLPAHAPFAVFRYATYVLLSLLLEAGTLLLLTAWQAAAWARRPRSPQHPVDPNEGPSLAATEGLSGVPTRELSLSLEHFAQPRPPSLPQSRPGRPPEPCAGIYAQVLRPGRVQQGDTVHG